VLPDGYAWLLIFSGSPVTTHDVAAAFANVRNDTVFLSDLLMPAHRRDQRRERTRASK